MLCVYPKNRSDEGNQTIAVTEERSRNGAEAGLSWAGNEGVFGLTIFFASV